MENRLSDTSRRPFRSFSVCRAIAFLRRFGGEKYSVKVDQKVQRAERASRLHFYHVLSFCLSAYEPDSPLPDPEPVRTFRFLARNPGRKSSQLLATQGGKHSAATSTTSTFRNGGFTTYIISTSRYLTVMQSSHDVPMLVVSPNAQAERRISPSWTVDQLKTKLESVTGIPPSAQRLSLKVGARPAHTLEGNDDALLDTFALQSYAEIHVSFLSSESLRNQATTPPRRQRRQQPHSNATSNSISSIIPGRGFSFPH